MIYLILITWALIADSTAPMWWAIGFWVAGRLIEAGAER